MKQRLALCTLIAVLGIACIFAQSPKRKVEPVKASTNKTLTPPKGTDEKIIQTYLTGDTAKAKSEARKDSLRRVYPRYPKVTDVTFSVGVGDLLLPLFGQKYGALEFGASINLWNRLQPAAEIGLGWANNTPDDMNFTYKGKLAPFVKIGANYNFLFKNEPRYQLLAMARLGASAFGYDIKDVTVTNSYWKESTNYSITGERSNAIWGELGAGIKVGLTKNIALGWNVKYHALFTYKKNASSIPWHIPGYGPRSGKWAFGLNVSYTIPRNTHKWPSSKKDGDKKDGDKIEQDTKNADSNVVNVPQEPKK